MSSWWAWWAGTRLHRKIRLSLRKLNESLTSTSHVTQFIQPLFHQGMITMIEMSVLFHLNSSLPPAHLAPPGSATFSGRFCYNKPKVQLLKPQTSDFTKPYCHAKPSMSICSPYAHPDAHPGTCSQPREAQNNEGTTNRSAHCLWFAGSLSSLVMSGFRMLQSLSLSVPAKKLKVWEQDARNGRHCAFSRCVQPFGCFAWKDNPPL